jgi:hypothetical protein
MLGNLATDEDITLTIEIHVVSVYNEPDDKLPEDFEEEYTQVTMDTLPANTTTTTTPTTDENVTTTTPTETTTITTNTTTLTTQASTTYDTTTPTDNIPLTTNQTQTLPPTSEVYGIKGYSTSPRTGDSFGGVLLVMALTTIVALATKPHHKDGNT